MSDMYLLTLGVVDKSLQQGNFPSQLKITRVTQIYKKGLEPYNFINPIFSTLYLLLYM